MATYYVDPAATGLNDGSSWENAFTDLQNAVTACVGDGNIIYARGTQTLISGGTSSIDFTSAASGVATSFNQLIGCNSSGVEDGTRFSLTGNNKTNGAVNGIKWATSTYWRLKNIEVRECGASGFGGGIVSNWSLINCKSTNNTGYGFDGLDGTSDKTLFLCVASGNTNNGFTGLRNASFYFCLSKSNGARGFNDYTNIHYGCIAVNNSAQGFYSYLDRALIHCVAHGNLGDGMYNAYSQTRFIACRATNNAEVGFGTSASHITNLVACYASNNVQSNFEITDTLKDLLFNEVGTSDGYVDAANGDYNLTADATMRRVAITLPE